MIYLQTEFFKLNLSNFKVKFIEKNSFFKQDIFKQQSFPFKIPRTPEFSDFFFFLDSFNDTNSQKRLVECTLTLYNKSYIGEFTVLSVERDAEVVVYFYVVPRNLLDKKIDELNWESLNVADKQLDLVPVGQNDTYRPYDHPDDNIYYYANQVKDEDYPTTKINFPEIYAPDLRSSGYAPYLSRINKILRGYHGSEYFHFSENDSRTRIYAEMRPFIYLKEVITFLFQQAGYSVIGDFINNAVIAKALLIHNNTFFYTNIDFVQNGDNISMYYDSGSIYDTHITINDYGTYDITVNVEVHSPTINSAASIYVRLDGQTLATSDAKTVEGNITKLSLSVRFDIKRSQTGSGVFQIAYNAAINDNSFTVKGSYELTGTERPLYKETIDLKELVPKNTTIGDFLKSVRTAFILNSKFDFINKTVEFSFFKNWVKNTDVVDLSDFETPSKRKKFNRLLGYSMEFEGGFEFGFTPAAEYTLEKEGFTSQKFDITPLEQHYINYESIHVDDEYVFKHQTGLGLLFYEGNTKAVSMLDSLKVGFSRLGFFHHYLREYYYQLLNGIDFPITLFIPLYISSTISVDSKIRIFNTFFLIKELQRERAGKYFERITLKLISLKPFLSEQPPGGENVNLVVTDQDNPFGVFENKTSYIVNKEFINNKYYFKLYLFANGSNDYKYRNLNYEWEIITEHTFSTIKMLDNPYEIEFFNSYPSGSSPAGVYTIKLTISNDYGDSKEETLTITVV